MSEDSRLPVDRRSILKKGAAAAAVVTGGALATSSAAAIHAHKRSARIEADGGRAKYRLVIPDARVIGKNLEGNDSIERNYREDTAIVEGYVNDSAKPIYDAFEFQYGKRDVKIEELGENAKLRICESYNG
ncbi:hypothetical protein [Natrinema halophilum]|uniref:Uncharacterized protein n=1 Tax=Natrinema halophilum TaxID=1699371 RepID=A0A7D5KET9_9EURY|nr:hypothetical protein [Natrinema halophilum]QLG50496.1 hypothetical protein HYG82_17400 [Natrinema halophilum]